MENAPSFGAFNSGFQAGIINGPVSTQFHHHPPLELLEAPPNPSMLIPYSRDTDFIERGILNDIHQKCAVSGSWTALVGLGGVGKSQLAIEYAYRTRDRLPETWVFWVHASNAARFEEGFRDIANYVKIYGRMNPHTDIIQLVHDWLRDERKGKWVLILDNVDEPGFLADDRRTVQDGQTSARDGRNLRPIHSYLPQCQHGTILITTRTKQAALQLVEDRSMIIVEPMDKLDAVALFKKKLGPRDDCDTDGDNGDIGELVVALDFMPLAIVQAAAYISQRAPRCSVSEYLDKFRKSDREKIILLGNKAGHLRRDREAQNSIIITWRISFEHIRQSWPSAADLLSLMSLFDRQGIPEQLICNRAGTENSILAKGKIWQRKWSRLFQYLIRLIHRNRLDRDGQQRDKEPHDDNFENDVLVLRNYAFISVSRNQSEFSMHALVQLAMRTWLEAKEDLERWRQYYCKILCHEFPESNFETWARCQELFPHAQSAVAQKPKKRDSLIDWASLLYNAASYAIHIGNGVEAENMAVKAMNVRKEVLGNKHDETLLGMSMAGLAYKLTGRLDEAEELEVQVMKTCKMKFGLNHPDTLNSITHVAFTYHEQHRWDEAKELSTQVLKLSKTLLEVEQPNMLNSMANLTIMFSGQLQWDIAEKLGVQVVKMSKTILGVDHLYTLMYMDNLANTIAGQGRLDEAEELGTQAVRMCKMKFGVCHPQTLHSMSNLAMTFERRNRWNEAQKLRVHVVEAYKMTLGVDHPYTLTSMNQLATLWMSIGAQTEAIEMREEFVQSQDRILGPSHAKSIASHETLDRWKSEVRIPASIEVLLEG